jgi:AcrR family transcriptional regulator
MTHSFDTDTPPESSRRQISLRERKFARTKHALLQAALERLRDKRLDEIPVKDLCEQVEVSEATFFNYFPKKEDLLRYYMQILTLDLVWHARNRAGDDAGLEYIEAVFERAAKEFGEHPRLMLEIIAFMAQQPDPANCPKNSDQPDLSLAERLQALPNRAGVENVPEVCFEDLVRPPIERAVHRGERGSSSSSGTA